MVDCRKAGHLDLHGASFYLTIARSEIENPPLLLKEANTAGRSASRTDFANGQTLGHDTAVMDRATLARSRDGATTPYPEHNGAVVDPLILDPLADVANTRGPGYHVSAPAEQTGAHALSLVGSHGPQQSADTVVPQKSDQDQTVAVVQDSTSQVAIPAARSPEDEKGFKMTQVPDKHNSNQTFGKLPAEAEMTKAVSQARKGHGGMVSTGRTCIRPIQELYLDDNDSY